MRSLLELLQNHPIPGVREANTRRVCSEAIQSLIGIPIAPGKIRVQNGVLSLSVPPVAKSAILIRKSELCKLLADQAVVVTEIR